MFDDMEGLAQLERINQTPGTQYFLEVNYGRPTPYMTTTLVVEGVSRTQHRWMIKTDMVESRRAFQQAENLEEFKINVYEMILTESLRIAAHKSYSNSKLIDGTKLENLGERERDIINSLVKIADTYSGILKEYSK